MNKQEKLIVGKWRAEEVAELIDGLIERLYNLLWELEGRADWFDQLNIHDREEVCIAIANYEANARLYDYGE